MKRIFSVLICLIMIASAAAFSVSAEEKILFLDRFDSMDNDDWGWGNGVSNFVVRNGVLEGDPTAAVHQTQYGRDASVLRIWSELTNKVDVRIVDYEESSFYGAGLWWRDYNTTYEEEDAGAEEDGEIWTYTYDYVSNSVTLASDYLSNHNMTPKTYKLPRNAVKIGPDDDPTTFSLGWRIRPGKIECYFNNELVITCTDVPADLGTHRASPILLLNNHCYIEFDNFVVATVDYDLFNDKPLVDPDDTTDTDTESESVTESETESEIVSDTESETESDSESEIDSEPVSDTDIDTEPDSDAEISSDDGDTAEPDRTEPDTDDIADTDTAEPDKDNGGSETGDAVFAAVAVMAASAVCTVVFAKRKEH